MKKLFLILLILLVGCNKQEDKIEINYDNAYYQVATPYKESVGSYSIRDYDKEEVESMLMKLSTVGSLFLGLVALLPQLATNFWNLPSSIGLGGTSLLIVIGVVLELSRQINGLLMKREYVGFIR